MLLNCPKSLSLSLSPLLTFLVLQMKPKNWHVPGTHTNTALNPIPWLLCFCSIRYLYLRVPWALQGLTHPKLSPFHPLICNALNFPLPLNFAAQKVFLSPVLSLSTPVPTNHRNVLPPPQDSFHCTPQGMSGKALCPPHLRAFCAMTHQKQMISWDSFCSDNPS